MDRDAAIAAQTQAEMDRDGALAAKEVAEDSLGQANTSLAEALSDKNEAVAELKIAESERDRYKDLYEQAKSDLESGGPAGDTDSYRAARKDAETIRAAATTTPAKDSVTQSAVGDISVTASRMGGTVTFKVTAGTGDDMMTKINTTDSAGSPWTMKSMNDAETGDEAAAGLTRRAVLYTDIDAPTDKKFSEVHLGDTQTTVTLQKTTINKDVSNADHMGYAVVINPNFGENETTAGYVADANIPGSYDGAAGTYMCAGGCTFTMNDDGTVSVSDVTFTFTPTDPDSLVSVQDDDYITFGAWLDNPQAVGGIRTVAAFADGDGFTADRITTLTGEATYSGKATGYYAERFAGQTRTDSGEFSATAELTADFDMDMAGNEGNSISGNIKEFELSSNRSVTWLVVLPKTNIMDMDNGSTAGVVSTNTGGAGGMSWTAGNWGFQLVGDNPGYSDLTTDQHKKAYPTGIIGTFGAHTGSANSMNMNAPEPAYTATGEVDPRDVGFVSVIGAFGARLDN